MNNPTSEIPVHDSPRSLSVNYSLTRGDILRWNFYALRHNKTLIAYGMILLAFSLWMNLRSGEMATQPTGFKIFYSVVFIIAWLFFVSLLVMLVMLMMVSMVMVKKYRGFLGEHELEIREEGLMERTDVNESVHRWAGFDKIVHTSKYLYIYVTDHNFHIVPLKYFGSETAELAFRDELERHIKAARNSSAAARVG